MGRGKPDFRGAHLIVQSHPIEPKSERLTVEFFDRSADSFDQDRLVAPRPGDAGPGRQTGPPLRAPWRHDLQKRSLQFKRDAVGARPKWNRHLLVRAGDLWQD